MLLHEQNKNVNQVNKNQVNKNEVYCERSICEAFLSSRHSGIPM